MRTIETNVHSTEVVLRAAAKKKPVFVASTSEVTGRPRSRSGRTATLVLGADARRRDRPPCCGRRVPGPRLLEGAQAPTVVGGCSTRSGRARPAATGWSSRASSGRRSPSSRASTATAPSSASSATSPTSCGRWRLIERRRRLRRGLQHRRHRGDLDLGLAERVRTPRGSRVRDHHTSPTTRPTSRASRTCCAAYPTLSKIRERLGWQPERALDQTITDVVEHHRASGEGGLSSGAGCAQDDAASPPRAKRRPRSREQPGRGVRPLSRHVEAQEPCLRRRIRSVARCGRDTPLIGLRRAARAGRVALEGDAASGPVSPHRTSRAPVRRTPRRLRCAPDPAGSRTPCPRASSGSTWTPGSAAYGRRAGQERGRSERQVLRHALR